MISWEFLKQRRNPSGVGAQYESEIIYHNLKKHLEDLGVIFWIWMKLLKHIQKWCKNIL